MVGKKLFKKFSAWLARKSLETKLKDEEKKREELESKRKCSVLDSILKCKIPGFSGFSIIDGKIAVFIEPESGYGESWDYLAFKDETGIKVKVPSRRREDALSALATACKWSSVVFLVPPIFKFFYDGKESILVAKRGDNFESLSIEGELAQGGAL